MFQKLLLGFTLLAGAFASSCSSEDEAVDTAVAANGQSESPEAGDSPSMFHGQWTGSWGGGETGDGVVFQPVLAELVIDGDTVQLSGFPEVRDVAGTIQIDADAQKVIVTPDAEDDENVELTYELAGDELTLTVADGRTVSLTRKQPQVEATESDEVPLP